MALNPRDYVAEWKWDGIRVQVSARDGAGRIFSRTGDEVSGAFPDVARHLTFDAVLDGELLVVRDGTVAPFNDLQQRLGRKTVSTTLQNRFPAHVRLYDILFEQGEDLRPLPFATRRRRLETWFAEIRPERMDLSPLVPFEDWDELAAIRGRTRADGIEGLMLKRRDAAYVAGRPKGPWFKWKRDPLTVDCVLMYAQRGHGKRSSFYSDFTFGAWRAGGNGAAELVPVGKAYFGFTDEELAQLDRFVRNNTTNRFGPVREVVHVEVKDPNALPLLDEDGQARTLEALEVEIIRFALRHYRGHMSEVSRRLGIGRSTLYRKLKEFGLEDEAAA